MNSDDTDSSQLLDAEQWGIDTQAIRTGVLSTNEGAHAEPIFLTSSFVYESAKQAAARFSGEEPGNVYSRYTNPTVNAFETRLAAMEHGERCVAFSSGMAAIGAACLSLAQAGDHVISSRSIFGSTTVLMEKYLGRCGIDVTFVDATDLQAVESAFQPGRTKLLFLETPSNPMCEIMDIQQLADICHRHDARLLVDNCFCSPALQTPLDLGADLVIHSATKYIDGQGRCLGGAVVGPSVLMDEVLAYLRTMGSAMSPFNAWVFLKGLETLSLRMERHCSNALALARWLEVHPRVLQVNYAGLESHPGHELAKRQQRGFGGLLSFVIEGGQEEAWQVIDRTRFMSISANLGDAKTILTHPDTTTHSRVDLNEKRAAGIVPGLIRCSLGLENIDDIIADFEQMLG